MFKKKEENKKLDGSILIAALLVHAAKIDENYTEVEKKNHQNINSRII